MAMLTWEMRRIGRMRMRRISPNPPIFQPFCKFVTLLRRSDAPVEFGEDFAEAALGVGLFTANGFVPADDLAISVATQEDPDLPGAGAAV